MGQVAIVTDSTADLDPAAAAAAGLRIVPLSVRFGDEEFRDGIDISPAQFWARLLEPGAPCPMTAAPSPGSFIEAFEQCFAEGAAAVVCVTIGSGLSATCQSATLGAGMLAGREIHVIDTGTTSMATGIAALLASELAATGIAAAAIAAAVRDRLADIDLYVAIDTLEYLRRNGRLSAARAAVGTVLSVKPIITVRDGVVVLADKPRTRGKARERAVELITAAPLERVAIMHTPTSTPDEVAHFRDRIIALARDGIDVSRVTTGLIGASTGPHLGPGMIGAAFLRRH
jgi:DegV family protein with EDD domain